MAEQNAQPDGNRDQRMLTAVAFASEQLLRHDDWRPHANRVLEELGLATEASRAYLFENRIDAGRLLTTQPHEWTVAGIAPQRANPALAALPMAEAGYARWIEVLSRGETVHGPVDQFPPHEQDLLRAQDIRSLLVAPIFVRWWGFIGFDDCASPRIWTRSECEILKTAARMLGAAIER